MEVEINKITDEALLRWACSLTIDSESKATLKSLYRNEHSPIRTQMFTVTMTGIPTFVSTHFCRHDIGVVHFIKSLREDRCGKGDETRWTPTNHGMFLNAQALLNMARKRLCYKCSPETREVMECIKDTMFLVDEDLANRLVPECVYRGSCHEDKPCGKMRR